MTNRRRIGIGGLIFLMIAIGIWVVLPKHGSLSWRMREFAVVTPDGHRIVFGEQIA